ncbi:hypothetical protein SmJEL517_g00387 [Synchytrium microbalum]|uniref:E2 ubiquitin-conjugating enzyme n=1 Tax=Synchytrium microbalum TaxID=1806994 RepID=A0A507CJ14_9FUNG|nr:uncharacterized protein SmJEL517_g00387 [Synchytrium microbalum]TPX38246.1 hypothetical protein SmJEL517_g00387 [Synchytrium microbalum]
MNGKPAGGIKILLNEENIMDIQALIHGPEGTPFEGGVFRIKLIIGSEFPNEPPKGFFVTKIFHPNVSKAGGEICVDTLKRDWKKDYGIDHILLVIRCLLIAPNPESALNEEAGKLLLEDYSAYTHHAAMWTRIHAPNKGEFPSIPKTKTTTASATGDKLVVEAKLTADSSIPNSSTTTTAENTTNTTTTSPTPAAGTTLAEVLGPNAHGNVMSGSVASVKKRPADKKLEKEATDKKRTLRRL